LTKIAKPKGPRLSFSGADLGDPLTLQNSDDDSSQDVKQPVRKRAPPEAVPLEKSPAPKQQGPKKKPPNDGNSVIELDDDSSVDEQPKQPEKMNCFEFSFSSDEDDKSLPRKPAAKVAVKPPFPPSTPTRMNSFDFSSGEDNPRKSKLSSRAADSSSSDDEDIQKPKAAVVLPAYDSEDADTSDDSLRAIKQLLVVRRKPAPCSQQSALANSQRAATKKNSSLTDKAHNKEELAKTKEAERLKQQEARLQAREQKEAAKEAAKLQKARQREEKKVTAAAEKDSKKRHREECAQAAGKLARKEIAVLLEHHLFQTYSVVADLQDAGYLVQEHPSALQCNAVQWIRNDSSRGGAASAVQNLYIGSESDGYQHLPVLAIVCHDAGKFLKMLERTDHEEEDDYPLLEMWLKGVECGWRAAWKIPSTANQRPRIILLLDKVLETLDKLWIQHRKKASRTIKPPPTAEELHDAITWILIQFQVECVHCKSADEISNHIRKMTRLLAEEPYQKQVTELECIKKLKAECSDMDPPIDRAKDCWLRQLQQLPRISRPMAMNLTCYYPTALALWKAYQDESLTDNEKRLLTADMFSENKTQAKLSSQLYTIMTSNDPNEILR
jgi:flagellar biosynthesis GTPase FlhF